MSLFFSKLGFIHRRLWERDGPYRVALVLGPAPLVGCGVAAGIWLMVQTLTPAAQLPEWWKPSPSATRWSTTGEPQTTPPSRPLPPIGANGGLNGYEAGWQATVNAIEIGPTLNVEVKPVILGAFFADGSRIDLEQIIKAGPQNARFAGVGSGFLAVRTPGVYALSLRFERPLGPVSDCLTRLIFGPRQIVSNLDLASPGNFSNTYDPARFDLQPGLYVIRWVFGCWRNQEVPAPARITVLVSHPGDPALQPARPDDIVRLEHIK